jgi:bifunctional non-homologous end joining protein LigD
MFSIIPKEAKGKLKKKAQPAWVDPMLATLTKERFSRKGWIFECKFDGERCLTFKRGSKVRLLSRNGKIINGNYPELADAFQEQSGHDLIADGEVVAFDGGITSFAKLQGRMQVHNPQEARHSAVDVFYYLFDLIYLDGYDISNLELHQRKKLLRQAINFRDPIRFTAHIDTEGEAYYQEACRKGWEGIIAKRAYSAYVHKRSRDWLKFKCLNKQELVIGGYTDPEGGRTGFGALLLGYYDGSKLIYAGKVGTGFNIKTLRSLGKKLTDLERDKPQFYEEVKEKGVHWVKPKLVAQIGFTEWTQHGKLRHPRFLGLRRDKNPKEVVKEEA